MGYNQKPSGIRHIYNRQIIGLPLQIFYKMFTVFPACILLIILVHVIIFTDNSLLLYQYTVGVYNVSVTALSNFYT